MFTVPKRRGHPTPRGPYGKHQGWSDGRENEAEIQARAFIVVSEGRNKQDRVKRFRIG